ncbi:MAG: hypothetical protein R3C03_23975 [Pirellulaceae bacterium]
MRIALDWLPREGSVTPVAADMGAKTRNEDPKNESFVCYLVSIGLRKDAKSSEMWEYVSKIKDSGQRAEVQKILDEESGLTPPESVRNAIDKWTGTGEGGSGSGGSGGTRNSSEGQGGDGGSQSGNPIEGGERNDTPTGMTEDDVRRIMSEDRERSDRIMAMFRDSGVDNPDLERRAVREGWTPEQTAIELLPLARQRSSESVGFEGAPAGHVRQAPTMDALGLAMMLHNGKVGVDQRFDDPLARAYMARTSPVLLMDVNSDERQRAMEDAHRLRLTGCRSLFDFCQMGLRMSGDTRHYVDEDELIRSALSNASVQKIFTTDVNARLIASYNYAADTTRAWCREDDVPDFKISEDIVMGSFGALTRHSVGKTAQDMDVDTESFTSQIYRYTGKFSIDEMDIINDRFGALERHSPEDIGRSANQVRPSLVYSLLLKNPTFNGSAVFAAGRNNLFSGGADALSEAAIQAAEGAMGDQRIGERVLDLPLKFIIVPRQLKFPLKRLLRSTELRDNTASKEYGTYNPIHDEDMMAIVDSRIGTKGVTDPVSGTKYTGTATNWFAATDRGQASRTICVKYRRGTNRRPLLRSYMMREGRWGIGWDIVLDIGAHFEDYRGVQKHAGA